MTKSNGGLSGTPANSNVGLNVFTVRVKDASGYADEATMNITVLNANRALDVATWLFYQGLWETSPR